MGRHGVNWQGGIKEVDKILSSELVPSWLIKGVSSSTKTRPLAAGKQQRASRRGQEAKGHHGVGEEAVSLYGGGRAVGRHGVGWQGGVKDRYMIFF